jgi:hypothetical protein
LGEAAHRVHRRVHGVDPGIDGREHAGGGYAAGVVSVEMDGYADLVLQCRDEFTRGARSTQPGHVLDAEDVSAGGLEFTRHPDVVLEIVLGATRVAEVAGVADGRLRQLARCEHGIDRDAHVLHPVERIEDPEYVDAGRSGLLDEVHDHVVRVVLVTDRIRRPQQHLGQNVRHALPQ